MGSRSIEAFVLIGTQGSGKSATCNSIIGENKFEDSPGTKPFTQANQTETWHWKDHPIAIIDTPELKKASDLKKINTTLTKKYKFIKYGFVISIGRILSEDKSILEGILSDTKQSIDLVLILSRYDELKLGSSESEAVAKWISGCPSLAAIIKKFNVKVCSFANYNATEQAQIKQLKTLMSTIMDIIEETDAVENSACLKSEIQATDNLPVNRELLEEHFGKSGVYFYNEVLKKRKA